MKGLFAAIFICLALLAISPKESRADTTVIGSVNYAGQMYASGTAFAIIYLTPTGQSMRAYVLPSGGSNGMLAVALTAMSTGKTVTCQMDSVGNMLAVYLNS